MISPKSKIKIVHFQYVLSSLLVPETAGLMWWTSSYKNTFQIWYDSFDNFSSKFESYFLETVTKACSVERSTKFYKIWKFLECWEEIPMVTKDLFEKMKVKGSNAGVFWYILWHFSKFSCRILYSADIVVFKTCSRLQVLVLQLLNLLLS